MTWFDRYKEGEIIHAGPSDGNDYTLCGYALEGECSPGGEVETIKVDRGKINCEKCITIVRYAKAIPSRYLAK